MPDASNEPSPGAASSAAAPPRSLPHSFPCARARGRGGSDNLAVGPTRGPGNQRELEERTIAALQARSRAVSSRRAFSSSSTSTYRGARSERTVVACRDRDQPRCARHRRSLDAERRRAGARSAAWHPDPREGQHRHGRQHGDDRGLARARRRIVRRAMPSLSSGCARRARHLGKTNLSEWANFRSTHDSSGWSGRGGQTRNPYALDRTPSGSSSGSAVAVAASPGCRGRHRDRRLDHVASAACARRDQAHARPGEPQRHHSDRAHAGHRWTDGPHVADAAVLLARWRASIRAIR